MSSPLCVISSRPLEVALLAACASHAGEVIEWLNSMKYLAVPVEEVMAELSKLGSPSIQSARSAAMKKVRASKKKSVTAEIPQVKTKPEMQLPFCGVVEPTWCMGIRYNHGLHTQCMKAPTNGEYCATCFKSAKNSASGKPTYGNINDRLTGELLEFRDPKGKQTTCYANVAKKFGLDLEKAKAEAAKFGWTIPENQLTVQVVKRGRPAKKGAKVVKAKGKRGRPAKVVKDTNSMDEQIAQLVAEAAEDVVGTVITSKKVVRKTAEEKAAEKAAKKEAKAAAKAAEKEAKAAAKAAEKEAKAAAKAAAKEAKAAAKAAAKEAKAAAKAAEKEAKAAAKAAKAAKKSAAKKPSKRELKKKELQKEANEIGCEISDEQLASLKIGEIRTIIKDRKDYFKVQAMYDAMEAEGSKKNTPVAAAAATAPLKCTVKAVTTYEGMSVTTTTPAPVSKTVEDEVDAAIAEVDEELVLEEEPVVDSSDEEEDDESPEIDPDTTPKVTIDGETYYKVSAYGHDGLLFSMEGDLVGAHDDESNTIMEVEME